MKNKYFDINALIASTSKPSIIKIYAKADRNNLLDIVSKSQELQLATLCQSYGIWFNKRYGKTRNLISFLHSHFI